ncbi:MAG: LysE family transporter [Bacteroidia bacterium]|nr:LysE family transporter [Sphingobacteriaceae bacterium]MBK7311078.1 LysE family transporter [Sphingobacteriaceae bacterium]MBP9069514.1 LysE family transporter [Bacteroidia bacterium]
MILTLVYQTVIIALLLTFSFGPAFFALLNTSIKHGPREGSLLATGVILSDLFVCVLVIILISLGATNFIQDEKNQRFMGILAGLVLVVFGSFYFKKPVTGTNETIEIQSPTAWVLLLKGFFLNLLNPTVWLLWLGNVTAVSKTLEYSTLKMFIYFGITLGLTLTIEISKAYLASKIKKYLTDKLMHTINVATGILLVIFGIVLVYNHYF